MGKNTGESAILEIACSITFFVTLGLVWVLMPANGQVSNDVISIPFTMNDCNLPVVKSTVNGRELWLVIDTGSTYTVVDRRFRRHIDAKSMVIIFAGVSRVTTPVRFLDYTDENKRCGKVDGTMGQDIFTAYKSFHMQSGILILTPKE